MTQVAKQAQSGNQIAVLAALAAGLFLFLRRDKNGNGGNGGNGAVGQVTPSGQIGVITTTMGSHHVQKTAGQTIQTRVAYAVTALDSTGNAVLWTFRIITRVGHNTVFGWREIGRLFSGTESGIRTLNRINVSTPTGTVLTRDFFTAPHDPDQEWDVRVTLEAQRSDANGNPIPDDWIELATGEHVGAVRTIGGQAAVTGSVGSITVTQRRNAVSISRR